MAMRTYLVSYAVAMGSLLAGAAVVHNVYRPDLTIPGYSEESEAEGQPPALGPAPGNSATGDRVPDAPLPTSATAAKAGP
ncbi:hypothetical protein KFL_004510080 [Klebsormidium nitens]|uniref:Uncharacterized protein n=1 Tax=Klebsormidium nitens TaxID=105231 RepID=A0A1Y1IHX9_KLENI|nr:hypothetical protein KFL_004510080 [Klebsormidium nitens]|eukprot:GAQ88681.1 hypothetical protein KFL_004510080 [Klebsormidium nitens]